MADERPMPSAEESENGKVLAIFGYLCCFLIPLLGGSKNRFCTYHSEQAIILFIFNILCTVIYYAALFAAIAGNNLSLMAIGYIPYLVVLVFVIMGIVNAAQGQCKELPLIGRFGPKLNLMK